MEFVSKPSAANWYRAHNASIVAAYLEHRALAGRENRAERYFINVVLLRVLYAHTLVAAPRLTRAPTGIQPAARRSALGHGRDLLVAAPDRPRCYPLPIRRGIPADRGGIRTNLDCGVIRPRLQRLYEWSAAELGAPGLRELIDDGAPVYAWPVSERDGTGCGAAAARHARCAMATFTDRDARDE